MMQSGRCSACAGSSFEQSIWGIGSGGVGSTNASIEAEVRCLLIRLDAGRGCDGMLERVVLHRLGGGWLLWLHEWCS